ncbi:DUF4838 domain-containing protein [Kribbella sp.]|uniref:DUF4838 domain-containing protein n=1 Tax=Kribbella sp. TaxID=1871183 RepID=UPI002D4D6783|nr:DUF4838 domain-containing protein [Kribbella sp.]HZX02816.1 DUF4838 domain-containing protein [Kribbella sp.]
MSTSNVSRRTVLAVGGIAAAATLVPGTAQAASPTVELVHKGAPKYTIYHGPGEGPVTRQAARELSETIGAITGVNLPIVVGAQPPGGSDRLIVLGRENPLTARLRLDYGTLGDDGFALRTVGHTIYLTGPIPRGTLYGVYWVLDRLCGVRWWSPDCTRITRSSSLALAVRSLNTDQVPRFRFREVASADGKDAAYRQHNLLNGLRGYDEFDTLPRTAGIDTWSRYWPEDKDDYFHTILPESQWADGGQLKMMDPATRAAAADRLIAKIRQRVDAGEAPTASFAQNDQPWTPDAASKAFMDQHGGAYSAPLIDMMNDIATRVTRQVPNAMLETEAYTWSFTPPTGLKVHDAVVMTVAPISADFGKALMGPGNADVDAGIRGWGRIAKNIVIWDYLCDFHAYPQPFPNWWAMCESFPEFAKIPSIQGYFGEGAWNVRGTEFAHLRVWVLSRLMWNPAENPDALIREFLQGYYGPAAAPLYDYMKLMAAAVAATDTRLTCFVPENAPYLNFDSLTAADVLLDKAQALVQDDRVLSAHLAAVRLGVDFQLLIRRDEFGRYAKAHGISWDPDTTRRLARFRTELVQSGLTQYTETGGTLQQMIDRATTVVERVPAPVPQVAQGLPAGDWFEIQDFDFTISTKTAAIVPDDLASDHGTARMVATGNTDWAVMIPLDKLPAEGTWKLYVAARIPATAADGTKQALATGVWPPFGNVVFPSVDSMRDGRYHELAVPGTYKQDTDPNTLHWFWIAPVDNPDVPYLYVDRLIGVRA